MRPPFAPCVLALLLAACEERRSDPLSTASANEPSPNASILPAPLAGPPKVTVTTRDSGHVPSAGDPSADALALEPPRPLRDDDVLVDDTDPHSGAGLTLDARFRWLEQTAPRAPEASAEALGRVRERTSFTFTVELSAAGRMRALLNSPAFSLPPGSELRARQDRYGHALIWPGAATLTWVSPGALRALFDEARLDVTPLSEPLPTELGNGMLLGTPTRRSAVENSLGRVELEQGSFPLSAPSGALLCRLLLEFLAISPASTLCRGDYVPLRAEFVWPSGHHFLFEVDGLSRRSDLASAALATPPPGLEQRRGELPAGPLLLLVGEAELGSLHARAASTNDKPEPLAPKEGLWFLNRADSPRYLLLDGVPVARLPPGADVRITALKPGRYSLQARDFFGAESTPARSLTLPSRFVVGEEGADHSAH